MEIMINTDYHTHTTFSPDGQHSPAAMCEQALAIGMKEIAFTEHVEWHPPAFCRPDFSPYFEALAACQEQYGPRGLRVLSGVEIGNPHDYPDDVEALLHQHDFDVIVVSLHWLSGHNIQRQGCFENGHSPHVYEAYFTELTYMVALANLWLPPDKTIIAHFDRIFWAGILAGYRPDLERLESVVRDLWEVVAASGAALELNTRFLRFNPGWRFELVTMLRWFREAGGERIVVNSDAHRQEHLGMNFPLATQLLDAAGFAGWAQPVTPAWTSSQRPSPWSQADAPPI
jgi:histidinol-phosphatase (PHP family)